MLSSISIIFGTIKIGTFLLSLTSGYISTGPFSSVARTFASSFIVCNLNFFLFRLTISSIIETTKIQNNAPPTDAPIITKMLLPDAVFWTKILALEIFRFTLELLDT